MYIESTVSGIIFGSSSLSLRKGIALETKVFYFLGVTQTTILNLELPSRALLLSKYVLNIQIQFYIIYI